MKFPALFRFRGRVAGSPLLRSVSLAVATVMLMPPASWAQHTTVIVDWSAFDALGPPTAQPGNAVVLRPPPKRPVAAVPAAPSGATAPNRPAAAPPQVALAQPPSRPAAPQPPAASPPQSAAPPAALPAVAPALLPGRITTVRYTRGHTEIPAEGQDLLNSVAAQLAANGKLRLQLVGYASGSSDDAVEARRLSLQRAVQIRTYLIEKGVQSVRMDVRALGTRNDSGGAADRVDLVLLDR